MNPDGSLVGSRIDPCRQPCWTPFAARAARRWLAVVLVMVASGGGCDDIDRGAVVPPPAPTPSPSGVPVVRAGAKLHYTFFDHRAQMRTVLRIRDVEEAARQKVMVANPARPLEGDEIYVADLRKPGPSGRYQVARGTRGAWLDEAMPKITQLDERALAAVAAPPKKKRPRRRRVRKRKRKPVTSAASGQPERVAGSAAPTSGQPERVASAAAPKAGATAAPRVIIYGTAWCPSCKSARQFFQARGVAFTDYDVEKNEASRPGYFAVLEKFGFRRGAVPVIVVGKKAFQGFSPPQLQAALAGS